MYWSVVPTLADMHKHFRMSPSPPVFHCLSNGERTFDRISNNSTVEQRTFWINGSCHAHIFSYILHWCQMKQTDKVTAKEHYWSFSSSCQDIVVTETRRTCCVFFSQHTNTLYWSWRSESLQTAQSVWSKQILLPNKELCLVLILASPLDGCADIIINWVTDEWIRHHLPSPSPTIHLHSSDLLSHESWNCQPSIIKQFCWSKLS